MNETPARDEGFDEIALLGALLERWRLILGGLLLVGVATFALSLLIPNEYQSDAALIVNSPEAPLSGEAEPLDVEALQLLVRSTQVKRELFQRAREQELIDPRHDFSRFQENLTTALEQKNTRERELLPIVRLLVTHVKPAAAGSIANLWADIVLETTTRIYSANVEEYGQFANTILDQVDTDLRRTQDLYTTTLLSSDLDLLEQQLKKGLENYARVFEEAQQLEEKIAADQASLDEARRSIAEQSLDGVWIGNIALEPAWRQRLVEGGTPLGDQAGELARRIVENARRIVVNEQKLADFEGSNDLQFLTIELQNAEQSLDRLTEVLQNSSHQLLKAQREHDILLQELEKTPLKHVMRKAITDDAFWQHFFQEGSAPAIGDLPSMATEEMNPVHANLQAQASQAASRIGGLEGQLEQAREQIDSLRQRVQTISREKLALEQQRDAINNALESDRKQIRFLENLYQQDLEKADSLETSLSRDRAMLQAKRQVLDEFSSAIATRQQRIQQTRDRLDALTLDLENLKKTREGIASQARAASLLALSKQEDARSGVTLFYPAEANPEKVQPRRGRITITAMLIAGLALSAFVVIQTLARRRVRA